MPLSVRKTVLAATLALLISCGRHPEPQSSANAYVDSRTCAACHSGIARTYGLTGMARSFSPALPATIPETKPFYHKASDTWLQMISRPDGLYHRRWQKGYQGQDDNVEELKADYVMGSGNHVKTYLHRTTRGTLVELPLAWYAEKGGYWSMNPGFDSSRWPAHRKTGYDCMFCHNAYPAIPGGHEETGAEPVFSGDLPQGIDCQRCHGPGQKHLTAAQSSKPNLAEVRSAIVNPARFTGDSRMEVCMQCHLETTSFPLPNAIRRFDRGPFSYRAGEPLAQFELFFDHAPGTGHEGKFEIVSSVYRFRQSRCFLQSNGNLTCTTCHNPHDIKHGAEAASHYNQVCARCHENALKGLVASGKHPADMSCTECHMPKRRTEDVVHAVMTDHLIQRLPDVRTPLAELAERHGAEAGYQGEVVPYQGSDPLYTAVAQLVAKSNVDKGIPRLEAEIAAGHPERAEPYIELGDAYRDRGMSAKSAECYREALQRSPSSGLIARRLAGATGDTALLRRITQDHPDNAEAWYDLGLLESTKGDKPGAIAAFHKAAELDPDLADAQNSLGAVLAETGSTGQAEQAFRAALRIDPFHADAHANLASLLVSREDLAQAVWHFDKAVRLDPARAAYAFNYGVTLARLGRYDEAQRRMEDAVRLDPNLAQAHDVLGGLLEQRGRVDAALHAYQEAVRIRPDFGKAHLDLGTVYATRRDLGRAAEQFRKALSDPDPLIRQQAQESLAAIGVK